MSAEGVECICHHPGFDAVCLNIWMLNVAYYSRHRYVAYQQLTRLVWGYLGKDIRVVLPSCAVTTIRKHFPSADGIYTGYLEPEKSTQ
ncbi:hypothetical protein BaRGS_00029158 [Batillaria attramentaria]|uniref:P2X purinoreceptor 7 intracellular domain-containing protein n=1 Tax=Batillaria attramentaria TaxID=370345 RepID=A0ABD0JY08_9CAEN